MWSSPSACSTAMCYEYGFYAKARIILDACALGTYSPQELKMQVKKTARSNLRCNTSLIIVVLDGIAAPEYLMHFQQSMDLRQLSELM